MKMIINQIYMLNTKLPIKSMQKPVFITKNLEVSKIRLYLRMNMTKIGQECQKFDSFVCGK